MWLIEGQSSQCDEVAQPLSVCQSCCHGGGPWILAATQAGLSSHGHGSASAWEALVLPPPVFSVPFCFTTSFYLNFTSCPFSVYYFLRSSPGSRSTGNEGGTLRGVEFFFIVLGTHSEPSQGTLAFSSCLPYSPSLPSASILIWKAQVFSRPVSFLRSSHICPVFK